MKKLLLLTALFMLLSCDYKKVEDIEVISVVQRNVDRASVVEVEVKNNTDKLLARGGIKVVYKDKNDKIVGTGIGMIVDLPKGETTVVTCAAMDVKGAVKHEVQIEPMHYE